MEKDVHSGLKSALPTHVQDAIRKEFNLINPVLTGKFNGKVLDILANVKAFDALHDKKRLNEVEFLVANGLNPITIIKSNGHEARLSDFAALISTGSIKPEDREKYAQISMLLRVAEKSAIEKGITEPTMTIRPTGKSEPKRIVAYEHDGYACRIELYSDGISLNERPLRSLKMMPAGRPEGLKPTTQIKEALKRIYNYSFMDEGREIGIGISGAVAVTIFLAIENWKPWVLKELVDNNCSAGFFIVSGGALQTLSEYVERKALNENVSESMKERMLDHISTLEGRAGAKSGRLSVAVIGQNLAESIYINGGEMITIHSRLRIRWPANGGLKP